MQGVHCVDLGGRLLTRIYLQNLASIQPRTSPVKFARPLALQQRPRVAEVVAAKKGTEEDREKAEATLIVGVQRIQEDVARHLLGMKSPLKFVGSRDPTNFSGLALGCIEAKFCK